MGFRYDYVSESCDVIIPNAYYSIDSIGYGESENGVTAIITINTYFSRASKYASSSTRIHDVTPYINQEIAGYTRKTDRFNKVLGSYVVTVSANDIADLLVPFVTSNQKQQLYPIIKDLMGMHDAQDVIEE